MASSRVIRSAAKETLRAFLSDKECFNRFLDKVKVIHESDGHCVCEMKVEPRHCDPNGRLHDSMTTTLIDVVGSLATATKPGQRVGVSVDLSISFLKSVNVGEVIVIDAETQKLSENGVVFSKVDSRHCDLNGKLHGGFTTTMIDVVGSLAHFTKPGHQFAVSVNLSISFLKSVNVGEDIVIDATIVKSRDGLVTTKVNVRNKCDGELVAIGRETKFIGENVRKTKL